MSAVRLKSNALLLAAALAALGAALWQFLAARTAQADLAARMPHLQELEAKRSGLQEQLAAAQRRVAAAAGDRASVQSVVKASLTRVEAAAAGDKEPPVTADLVQTRYQRARELARSGQREAALREFLWCLDVGMRRISLPTGRRTGVILEIGQLGREYPEALTALRARRDQMETRVRASESDLDAVSELAAFNRTLGENDRTIELYDRLPAGDSRRRGLASGAFESLVDSQRYTDAVEGRSYGSMSSTFEAMIQVRPETAALPNADAIRKAARDGTIKGTAMNIEVLAGAGDLEHARGMIERLLAYDGSDETRAAVQAHLERAGHADLLGAAPKP